MFYKKGEALRGKDWIEQQISQRYSYLAKGERKPETQVYWIEVYNLALYAIDYLSKEAKQNV